MPPVHHRYQDLATVVDEVHALLDAWEQSPEMPLDPFGLQVLKLAVHEWIANLVQHADFGGRQPELGLLLQPEGERVRCVIEDNSRGFDFARQLVHQQHSLASATAPPERGRGLLLMIACTENLNYQPIQPAFGGDGLSRPPLQRLEFWVSPFPPFDTTPAETAFDVDQMGTEAGADDSQRHGEGNGYTDTLLSPPPRHTSGANPASADA